MRRLLAAVILFSGAAGLLAWGSAAGQPIQLYGTIGKAPAFFDVSRDGDTVSGWYFYLKAGKQIRLEGKLNPKGFFQIEEYTADTNTRTGTFSGRRQDGHWNGSWKNAAGKKPLPIAFVELKSQLTDIDGRFRCKGVRRDRQSGISVTQSLDLKLAKGRVKSLAISREQRADGETQSCKIAPGSMRQISTPVGILLRAKADKESASQHCTIRLYRAGDYLVVKPGNAAQAGDDCRGAGDVRFCSAGGFWSDLIVNRAAQSCKPVR